MPSYIKPENDKGFREWLENNNYVPGFVFTLCTKGTITSLRKEYNRSLKS